MGSKGQVPTMASEERRLLARLRGAHPSKGPLDPQATYDSLGRRHTAVEDVTPPRRKSSALTLSHLAAATPARSPSRVASDAVRDMARELEAVEARLSVYRQRRESPVVEEEEEEQEKDKEDEEEMPPQMIVAEETTPPHDTEKPLSVVAATKRTQQAGEVADEVEHALANCDRLLQQAKLQASAASLTRSLRSSGGSRPGIATTRRPHTESNDKINTMDDTGSPSSFSASVVFPEAQPSSYGADEEIELEATARAMRALIASHEREMEREEAVVREQSQRTQIAQLKEIERKFESKKKMVLLSLREKYETETRAVVKQAVAAQDQAQQDAISMIQEKMLAEREKLLNVILARHQADTEDQIKRVQVRLQAETFKQQQELEKQLQQEFEDTIHQMEQDTEVELQRWEQKQRLDMESNLLKRREQEVTSILRAQEVKTKELKHQIHDQNAVKEAEELEKLKKALAFGAQAQLQQLRKQLEADHERKISDTRAEAAHSLEKKLTDLKQVLKLAHKQELEQTERDLEKRHRVAIMEMHEELEMQHRARVTEFTNKAAKDLEETLSTLRKELEEQNKAKLDALQETMDRDHRVRMHQVEMEHVEECEVSLQQLRQRITERNQRELDEKLERMKLSKEALLDEAVLYLSIKPEERSGARGGTNTTEPLLQLKHLSEHLPKELQRAVASLVRDFEELTDEQQILLEKIGDCTGLYLAFKRQCSQLEAEVNDLRETLQTMHSQLLTKDDMAKKLYMANEALLKKLGIADT